MSAFRMNNKYHKQDLRSIKSVTVDRMFVEDFILCVGQFIKTVVYLGQKLIYFLVDKQTSFLCDIARIP